MKNNNGLVIPENSIILSEEEMLLTGSGKFSNKSVDVLWEWVKKYVSKSTASRLSNMLGYAVDYFTFVDTLRREDPAGYTKYVNTYNRHQYCCHTMHAFDGLCAGPSW